MANTIENAEVVPDGETRRDFLYLATGALAAVGSVGLLWSLVDSMNPSADVLAAGAPVDIDISKIQPGQQIIVMWRSHPIFVAHRMPAELTMLQNPQDIDLLSDPNSTVDQQPAYARNWHRSIKPDYLVVVGICTHLGCIPRFEPAVGGSLGPNWPGGYFCPCHGSRYDLSARVFKGVPAPYNLPVPPHRYVNDTVIRIGENPPGSNFELASIAQI